MALIDELGDRMKHNYEDIAKTRLVRRMPVIIRIDGQHCHTFTRGFEKPFDDVFMNSMIKTTEYLCKNIQGCVLGYTQSDEISLLLIDYQNLNSEAWFDNQVEKICSISASMATLVFNSIFRNTVLDLQDEANIAYWQAYTNGATFDSRCFNIPKEEVTNYFYWRQLDAIRNSINSCAQSKYPAKKLQGLNIGEVLAKMESDGFSWSNLPIYKQRGTAVVKNIKGEWLVDKEMPTLKDNDRFYVDRLLEVNDR